MGCFFGVFFCFRWGDYKTCLYNVRLICRGIAKNMTKKQRRVDCAEDDKKTVQAQRYEGRGFLAAGECPTELPENNFQAKPDRLIFICFLFITTENISWRGTVSIRICSRLRGMRGTFLSGYTKVETGSNFWINYYFGYYFYTFLCPVILFIFFNSLDIPFNLTKVLRLTMTTRLRI